MANKVYHDIDTLPIYRWWKIQSTGDYTHLLVKRKAVRKGYNEFLAKKWRDIFDQYVKQFGWGKNAERILEMERRLAVMKLDRIINNDTGLFTHIEILEGKLKRLKEKQVKGEGNFYKFKAQVEGAVGHQINIHETSVVEFYSLLQVLEDKQKEIPKKDGRKKDRTR